MKISVIVPVYKVEKYIEKCIQSLLDQTYTNFEALIVNDGSPDQSISIAKKLVGNDPRFIFLEKENGGLSSARNMGLDYATGDYIFFLDSDDFIDPNCFKECSNFILKSKSIDILLFGYIEVQEDSYKKIGSFMPDLKGYYQKEDIFFIEDTINYSVWNKLYKKDVFKNLRFVEGIIYEDKEISPELLYQKSIAKLDKYLYFYTIRKNSIMRSYNQNSLNSFLYIYDKYKKSSKTDSSDYYYHKGYILYCFYAEYMNIIKYSPHFGEDIENLKNNIELNKLSLKNIKRYHGVISKPFLAKVLFNINPSLLKLIYKMVKFLR